MYSFPWTLCMYWLQPSAITSFFNPTDRGSAQWPHWSRCDLFDLRKDIKRACSWFEPNSAHYKRHYLPLYIYTQCLPLQMLLYVAAIIEARFQWHIFQLWPVTIWPYGASEILQEQALEGTENAVVCPYHHIFAALMTPISVVACHHLALWCFWNPQRTGLGGSQYR